MPFTKALKGNKTNYEAPADIGVRPIKSHIIKRLCTVCKHYVASEKYCPILGVGITKPETVYCSWWKNKNEI